MFSFVRTETASKPSWHTGLEKVCMHYIPCICTSLFIFVPSIWIFMYNNEYVLVLVTPTSIIFPFAYLYLISLTVRTWLPLYVHLIICSKIIHMYKFVSELLSPLSFFTIWVHCFFFFFGLVVSSPNLS